MGDFSKKSGNKSEERGLVGKDAGDTGAAFDLLVDSFERIGGAKTPMVGDGEGQDGESLRDVIFEPGGEFGGGNGVECDDLFKAALGG